MEKNEIEDANDEKSQFSDEKASTYLVCFDLTKERCHEKLNIVS